MNEKLPLYKLVISDNPEGEEEVDFIALVEYPAIQRNFLAFNQQFVEPSQGEKQDEFLQRCIQYVIDEGKETEQAVAICNSLWEQHFAGDKVSFDYDDTLSTDRGKELASKEIEKGNIVYIISARQDKEAMLGTAKALGIPDSRIYATGSNKAKVEKVKELGISKHYDNNADVISELGSIGQKFNKSLFAVQSEEQRIVSGPIMIADLPIYRRDEQGEYYVVFDAAEIKKINQRFFEKGYQANVNIEHDKKVQDVFMFESFIIDREKGVNPPKGYEDLTDGSWWGSFKVNNDIIWEQCKDGTFNGFSIEGLFRYERAAQDIDTKDEETMAAIIEILKQIEQ